MAYCGCGTQSAKIRWGVMTFLLVLGVALFIGSLIEGSKCELCTSSGDCSKLSAYDSEMYMDYTSYSEDDEGDWEVIGPTMEGCSLGAYFALQWIGIICVLLSTIPCCINCCCAYPPDQNHMAMKVPVHQGQAFPAGPVYATPAQDMYGTPFPTEHQPYLSAGDLPSGHHYDAPANAPPPPGVPKGLQYSEDQLPAV